VIKQCPFCLLLQSVAKGLYIFPLIVGYVILIVLLAGIPGAIAGNIMTKYTITPLPSVLTCDVLFIVSTVLASGMYFFCLTCIRS
jgi:hypothetical protein